MSHMLLYLRTVTHMPPELLNDGHLSKVILEDFVRKWHCSCLIGQQIWDNDIIIILILLHAISVLLLSLCIIIIKFSLEKGG